jgi:hypothetical protein
MKTQTGSFILALVLAPLLVAADPSPSTYRLQIRVKESKPNAQEITGSPIHFQMVVQSRSRGKINASRRLPHYSASKNEAKELHLAALGNILECSPEDREQGVQLSCSFESSYVAPDQLGKPVAVGFLPVVHSRQVSTTLLVPLGTEVRFASFDDSSSGNRLEVFVLAERL